MWLLFYNETDENTRKKGTYLIFIFDMVPLLFFISLSNLIPNVLEFLLLELESILPE